MSELRYDPLRKNWVIIAAQRGRRPGNFQNAESGSPAAESTLGKTSCPFCPGNEEMTPPEVMAVRQEGTSPDSSGWSVRVIPNKYPALTTATPFNPGNRGTHVSGSGFGLHEVIIETQEHSLEIEDLSVEELGVLFRVYGRRLEELNSDIRFKAVVIFKNRGQEAGATLGHSHSQIMALPVIPNLIDDELSSCRDHLDKSGQCLMCSIIEEEIRDGARVVVEDDRFLVFAPFPSSTPFELFIVPRKHLHDFSMVEEADLRGLASVFKETLQRLNAAMDKPPYNLIYHSSPPSGSSKVKSPPDPVGRYYHWYIQISPKTTKPAGFERGTGIAINPTPPEEAAEVLRNIKI